MRTYLGLSWLFAVAISGSSFAQDAEHVVDSDTPARAKTASCADNHGSLGHKWSVHEIEQLQVANNGIGAAPVDPYPNKFDAYSNRRMRALNNASQGPLPDFVISGTFSDYQGGVMGPVMRDGKSGAIFDQSGKMYGRGGVALLEDGRIVICRPADSGRVINGSSINDVCGHGIKVKEFMGGGALLVSSGVKACSGNLIEAPCDKSIDLGTVQKFTDKDGAPAGIVAPQMRAASHTIVAIKGGRAFVVWSRTPKNGRDIQSEFCAAGFDDVIKFDGGNGFYLRGANKDLGFGNGVNPTGLLIKEKVSAINRKPAIATSISRKPAVVIQ